jgi:PAS domain S-box-containing protein
MEDKLTKEIKNFDTEAAQDSLMLLYEVGREFAAALDLRTVLHRVLFLSMKNIGAISGSIIVLNESGQPAETAFLMAGQKQVNTTLQLQDIYERGMAGWVAKQKNAVLVLDTSKDERWLRRPDDANERTGAKSAVSAPIQVRDELVGVITLVHPRPGFFNTDHLDLVKAIADQAGIAILNARLYAESQRQARVMTAVAESAAAINASLQLDEVFQRILDQISQALRVEGASLALTDFESGELEFRASTLKLTSALSKMRIPLGEGIAGWVALHGESALVADTSQDPRCSPTLEKKLGIERKSVLCVPIRSENQVIGVLEVDNPLEGIFSQDDLLVLSGIAEMAGTAIRHAQLFERQQAAHQRYRELFEDSIDPILITDWGGHILEANRQAELKIGAKSEQLRPFTIEKLHSINHDVVSVDYSSLTPGRTISYESELNTMTGEHLPIEVYVRAVYNEGNSYLQWILRDISERKNMEKMREDLVTMAYHDIRSPLANIVSSLGVIETMIAEDDPDAESLISIAMRATERIQRLTDSLLDINQLEAGQPVGNRQLVSPVELVAEALDAVLSMAQGKEIEIETILSEDISDVNVDADMIRRVIINLLENAIKFTPAKGKIWIGAKNEANFVRFWVEDTGPGIPAQERERIFDKFTRLHTQSGRRGFGLGLAYCRLAVIGHGGRIWVESETGSGANFQFALPV